MPYWCTHRCECACPQRGAGHHRARSVLSIARTSRPARTLSMNMTKRRRYSFQWLNPDSGRADTLVRLLQQAIDFPSTRCTLERAKSVGLAGGHPAGGYLNRQQLDVRIGAATIGVLL